MVEATGGEAVREVLGEVEGLRVQLVTLEPGQRIGWHRHTAATDTLVCVAGTVIVETRDPGERRTLAPGERLTILVGVVHTVSGEAQATCRFINVHAGGVYDFVPG
jgi:quercetin dioxygenase-like cupin family protein